LKLYEAIANPSLKMQMQLGGEGGEISELRRINILVSKEKKY
jgi:hypothetical protein